VRGPAQAGDAAEQPQGDALDLLALVERPERVPELVGQHRTEEQQRGGDRHGQVGGAG
jgi:hypothetical protein